MTALATAQHRQSGENERGNFHDIAEMGRWLNDAKVWTLNDDDISTPTMIWNGMGAGRIDIRTTNVAAVVAMINFARDDEAQRRAARAEALSSLGCFTVDIGETEGFTVAVVSC